MPEQYGTGLSSSHTHHDPTLDVLFGVFVCFRLIAKKKVVQGKSS